MNPDVGRRLRTEGYTYEAIREALADIGIHMSTSALRREVRRFRSPSQTFAQTPGSRAAVPMTVTGVQLSRPALPIHLAVPPNANGRDIAEAFFNAHPSNPLLKEIP